MGLPFELVQHTADLQIIVHGKTLTDLFKNAVIAMFQSIKPEAKNCTYNSDGLLQCTVLSIKRNVVVNAPTREDLLIDFLSQALYLCDVHNEVYLDVEIKQFTENTITAMLFGTKITGFENEIKAVTYHDLNVQQKDGEWQANIVFDI